MSVHGSRLAVLCTAATVLLAASARPTLEGPAPSFRQAALLRSDISVEGDALGSSAALDGERALLGAPGLDAACPEQEPACNAGGALLFGEDPVHPGRMALIARLVAAGGAAGEHLGTSVALAGAVAALGAPEAPDAGIRSGAVVMFEERGSDGWVESVRLVPSDAAPEMRFGAALALAGDLLLVGAPGWSGELPASGAAYTFQRDRTGGWTETGRLTPRDAAAWDGFGTAVALDGTSALIGAPYAEAPLLASGAAWVFQREDGGWREQGTVTPAEPIVGLHFGSAVAVDGDLAAVGSGFPSEAADLAWVFERSGDAWSQAALLTSDDLFPPDDSFGVAVAIEGDLLAVGAGYDTVGGVSDGTVHVFHRRAGAGWGRVARVSASDGESRDHLGLAVAVEGLRILAGAPHRDADASSQRFPIEDAGAAYLFSPLLVDPRIEVSGNCPGDATLTVRGLTPAGRYRLYTAAAEGSFVIEDGACPGTELGLADADWILWTAIDSSGSETMEVELPPAACGLFLQLLDDTSCATGNVMRLE